MIPKTLIYIDDLFIVFQTRKHYKKYWVYDSEVYNLIEVEESELLKAMDSFYDRLSKVYIINDGLQL